jgi:ketosteroid isomerase-like protein
LRLSPIRGLIEPHRRKNAIVGSSAVARHLYVSESELDGKPNSTKIGALQVWQKQDGSWKLLARQGYKLA